MGREPWWFETGHEWGEGIVYPHAMRERFPYFGLDSVFGTLDEFALRCPGPHGAQPPL